MAEFVDANSNQFYKAWKKLELQQWLKNHGLKVSGTKKELVARVENAKRAGVTLAGGSRVRVPGGTLYCCVPLCHSFKGKVVNGKPLKLHRLPLDLKLRRQWIRKLRNVRKNLVAKAGTRVCSLHFRGSDGPKPWCKLPTVFPSKPLPKSPTIKRPLPDRSKGLLSKPGLKARKRVCLEKRFNRFEDSFHDYFPSSAVSISADIVKEKQTDTGVQFCASSEDKNVQTETATCDVGVQVNLPLLTVENLKGNDEKTKFYTGIVNFGTFMLLFNSIAEVAVKLNYWQGKDSLKEKSYLTDEGRQKPGPQRKMRLIDEFLMVMMRLRLGLLEQDLADRFCVSTSTVSRILITWYSVLADHLRHLITWPSGDVIASRMPQCFKKFPFNRVIIDCTEFFIETPSSLVNQAITYSSYKSHNTFKVLVDISPSGAVTFLSQLWGGNASDKHIVRESGLLNLLEAGDSIMADKGFNIDDLLKPLGVTLNTPPKRDSNHQLTRKEVEQTRRIAAVQIHAERKMEQIKNFRILQGTIPATE